MTTGERSDTKRRACEKYEPLINLRSPLHHRSINRACRAACRFFSHQVADWSLAKSVYFVGTLGFPEDDVDRYRKNLRFANGTGKVRVLEF